MNSRIISFYVPDDYNNCTIIALAVCLNISYDAAHSKISAAGRQTGKGFRRDYLSELLNSLGFKLRTDLYKIGLEELCSKCSKGIYYILNRNHAFAVIDGTILDCNEPNKRMKVERVYERTT